MIVNMKSREIIATYISDLLQSTTSHFTSLPLLTCQMPDPSVQPTCTDNRILLSELEGALDLELLPLFPMPEN